MRSIHYTYWSSHVWLILTHIIFCKQIYRTVWLDYFDSTGYMQCIKGAKIMSYDYQPLSQIMANLKVTYSTRKYVMTRKWNDICDRKLCLKFLREYITVIIKSVKFVNNIQPINNVDGETELYCRTTDLGSIDYIETWWQCVFLPHNAYSSLT